MIHRKVYNETILEHEDSKIYIMGPVEPDKLKNYDFDKQLHAFRPPQEQHEALCSIANLPEGRIIVALINNTVVAYVTFLYPDPLERWSEAKMENLIELGAIEVASNYRGYGLGKLMLQIALKDDQLEDYIVFTTEYYWHWDLKGTGLDVWGYRKMMEKLMSSAGLVWMATDDPEISSHPANCLMVRIGKNVSATSLEAFDRIRFLRRYFY